MDLENDILSVIGHKFRRNLVHMTDSMNLILAESGNALEEVHRSDLQQMKNDAARLLYLVDDILELARLDVLPSEQGAFRMSALLDQALPQMAQTASDARRLLLIHTLPDDPVLPGNMELFCKGLLKGTSILLQMNSQPCLQFSVQLQRASAIFQIGETGDKTGLAALAVKDVFNKVDKPGTLRDLLFCIRIARWCGGQFAILGVEKEQLTAIRFELPILSVQ